MFTHVCVCVCVCPCQAALEKYTTECEALMEKKKALTDDIIALRGGKQAHGGEPVEEAEEADEGPDMVPRSTDDAMPAYDPAASMTLVGDFQVSDVTRTVALAFAQKQILRELADFSKTLLQMYETMKSFDEEEDEEL